MISCSLLNNLFIRLKDFSTLNNMAFQSAFPYNIPNHKVQMVANCLYVFSFCVVLLSFKLESVPGRRFLLVRTNEQNVFMASGRSGARNVQVARNARINGDIQDGKG